jgi:hypothetical protein
MRRARHACMGACLHGPKLKRSSAVRPRRADAARSGTPLPTPSPGPQTWFTVCMLSFLHARMHIPEAARAWARAPEWQECRHNQARHPASGWSPAPCEAGGDAQTTNDQAPSFIHACMLSCFPTFMHIDCRRNDSSCYFFAIRGAVERSGGARWRA